MDKASKACTNASSRSKNHRLYFRQYCVPTDIGTLFLYLCVSSQITHFPRGGRNLVGAKFYRFKGYAERLVQRISISPRAAALMSFCVVVFIHIFNIIQVNLSHIR